MIPAEVSLTGRGSRSWQSGGITVDNAPQPVAVITALFGAPDVTAAR